MNDLHLLAISMAVALPDICCSLVSDDGRTTADRYRGWCAENLKGLSIVTPDDLYSMRCGVLHNGRFGDMKHSVARIIFVPPGGLSISNGQINDAFFFSVDRFCRAITDAVHQWMLRHSENPNVKANVLRMMQYHPGGLAPYAVMPLVIA